MSGWDWPGVAAFGVSLVALALSWLAYRQRVKYHPQPKLVANWDRPVLGHYAVKTRQVGITNFGDATARDLSLVVPHSARRQAPWKARAELAPGDTWVELLPMQTGADWREGTEGVMFSVADGGGQEVRPEAVLSWRQAPFAKRKKRIVFRGPVD